MSDMQHFLEGHLVAVSGSPSMAANDPKWQFVLWKSRPSATFDVRGRRRGKAAKGTHKRSLWTVPLDGIVNLVFAYL